MDCSLNIVDLIESNPITKLSNTYNNRLLTKIKETFSETQQQLFVSSFYCYLNYNQSTDFVIDLDNVWQWLGFSQKYHAKTSLEKNFIENTHYKILLPQLREQKNEGRGGHNREQIMLNVKTFKLFCIKSGTKKANEIHEYFVKLEEILHELVQEESDELKQQLEQATTQIQHIEEKHKHDLEKNKLLEREKILRRDYATNGPLVYIIRVKSYENGCYVIKIGESSKGIEGRYNEHKNKYPECVLLDCYPVVKSRNFEKFLHGHEIIRKHIVRDLPNHEKENELFMIGKELTYGMVTRIIHTNLQKFNEFTPSDFKQMLEEVVSSQFVSENRIESTTPANTNELLCQVLQNQTTILERLADLEQRIHTPIAIKTTTNFGQPLVTVGPRLQKINPENLSLVQTYESVAECIKESKHKLKRPSIEKAVQENTIYGGFRWTYRARDADPTMLGEIAPTRPTRPQNMGYIAKLNADKTQIIHVYLDRKTAATENGFQPGSLDTSVKVGAIARGHYYVLYDKCERDLITQFENQYGEPVLYKDGVGIFNADSELVQEFVCKYDCIKQQGISDKTLKKALGVNVLYNGYYYRLLGSKTSTGFRGEHQNP